MAGHWGFSRGPKAPPPVHGIKIRTVGTTWWGKLWISALEKLNEEYAGRLARGKTYARGGRVHDLVVARGKVSAKVTGSDPRPYVVAIDLPPLSDEAWRAAITTLGAKARFAAELLAGDMPKDVDEAFQSGGTSLFPTKAGDLTTKCSCPDWANPCKHVAATHYVLGDSFDRDPFLLFELRGRTRAEVLDATKAARGGAREKTFEEHTAAQGVKLGKVKEDDYDDWREPPPPLRLSFTPPAKHAAVIGALGVPASWREKASPLELLASLVHSASNRARAIALSAEDSTEPGEDM